MLATLEAQRRSAAVVSSVELASVQGETQVRVFGFDPAGSAYDLASREIRLRLRAAQQGELLFAGAAGRFGWSSEQVEAVVANILQRSISSWSRSGKLIPSEQLP